MIHFIEQIFEKSVLCQEMTDTAAFLLLVKLRKLYLIAFLQHLITETSFIASSILLQYCVTAFKLILTINMKNNINYKSILLSRRK